MFHEFGRFGLLDKEEGILLEDLTAGILALPGTPWYY